MFARRSMAVAALLLMTGLFALALILARSALGKSDPHAFELAGGRKVSGFAMRLQPERLLLQSEKECLLLSADDIAKIDGRALPGSPLPTAARVPRRQEMFERILPSGQIELHSTILIANPGPRAMTEVNWGLGAHELSDLRDYHVIDGYGSELTYRVQNEPGRQGKRVVVALRRPILPGEELRLTTVVGDFARVEQAGEEWRYQMGGDYPDDRLVTRTVLLPKGAEILEVSPEPIDRSETEEGPVVTWRRYFLRGEVVPWRIRYTLPA